MLITDLVKKSLSLEIQTKYSDLINNRLTPSMYFSAGKPQEETSLAKSNMLCILGAYIALAEPAYYLEIGTRRGHSACMAAFCAAKPMYIYCFDLWMSNYAGEDNPGPQFVQNEYDKVNRFCNIEFITGNSTVTVPHFLGRDRLIDVVLVDGDHSDGGALLDLENVVKHIPVNGLIIFDDITCPQCASLLQVWRGFISKHPNFEAFENRECPNGWAIALRKS